MLIKTVYFFILGNCSTTVQTTHLKFEVIFLIYFGYALIFLISIFGNSVIVHIIRTDSSMKTSTTRLILHQACANLLTTLIGFINAIHYSSYNRLWSGGLIGLITCKFYQSVIVVLPNFSVWILVAIAVDRFYAVARPLRSSPISQKFNKVVVILWTLSLISSINIFVDVRVEKIKESYYCRTEATLSTWPEFNIFSLALNVIFPLLLIAILYTMICVKLWTREVPGEGASQNQRQAEALETARKVTRMMIAVVVLFLVCWLPFLITIALHLLGFAPYNYWFLFPIWLTVVYSGLNPFVYFTLSANFRNGLKRLFGNIRVIPFRSQSIELQRV